MEATLRRWVFPVGFFASLFNMSLALVAADWHTAAAWFSASLYTASLTIEHSL